MKTVYQSTSALWPATGRSCASVSVKLWLTGRNGARLEGKAEVAQCLVWFINIILLHYVTQSKELLLIMTDISLSYGLYPRNVFWHNLIY